MYDEIIIHDDSNMGKSNKTIWVLIGVIFASIAGFMLYNLMNRNNE